MVFQNMSLARPRWFLTIPLVLSSVQVGGFILSFTPFRMSQWKIAVEDDRPEELKLLRHDSETFEDLLE